MKLFMKITMVLFFTVLFAACKKMPLQDSFNFDENAHPPIRPPFNMTIFEFMTSQADFSLMVEAIKRIGMESAYSSGSDNKTVLLLRNEAMSKFLKDYSYSSIANVPANKLENLLKYHVITTRFTQNDLPVQKFVVFQTLITGSNGRINIYKYREYWQIQINNGGPDLPGTQKTANVYLHNYEFTNGVGHQMQQYVQWTPY